jgi:hypothetical protein
MIPYLLLLVFVTVIAYLGRRSGHRGLRLWTLVAVGVVLVLFAGLRDGVVGTDTGNYIRKFYDSDSFYSVIAQPEFGYYLLSWFCRSMSDSYAVLLTSIAAIVVACYMATIVRLAVRYETSLYLFITLGVYTFFFNGARQGLAASLCFLSLPFLLQRRVIPYLLLILLASTFHKTALIAIPLYWVASSKVRWSRLIWLAGTVLVATIFLQVFVGFASDFLGDKYAFYGETGEGGGGIWAAFLVGQGAMLYYFKRFVSDTDGWYARLLNIYLVGLVPVVASVIASVNPSGVLRLHLYFSSTAILLWPMVFRQFRQTPLRAIISLGFMAITMGFFVMTTTTFSHLSPYMVNSALFHDGI